MKRIKGLSKWLLAAVMRRTQCEKCGSGKNKYDYYIRGWNDYCEQADGDWGHYCYKCGHITFDQSLEEYKSKLPKWCRAYGV